LLHHFSNRPVYTIGDCDDDRLGVAFWLAHPPIDEADQDGEQNTCDLVDVCNSYIPDLNLYESVCQLCQPCSAWAPYRRGTGIDGRADRERAGMPSTGDWEVRGKDAKARRPFLAPMRGRGFPSVQQTNSRGDPFRSRPPNTSRPPSLHVDDFIKLESVGHQPTGPTGYNKASMRAAKELISSRPAMRGRGFGAERGSCFIMGRRENSRGLRPLLNPESLINNAPGSGWAPPMGNRTIHTPEAVRDRDKFLSNSVGRGGGRMMFGARGWAMVGDHMRGRRDGRHPRSITR